MVLMIGSWRDHAVKLFSGSCVGEIGPNVGRFRMVMGKESAMRVSVVLVRGLGLSVLLAIGMVSRADEEKVALKDVPKGVLETVKTKFPKGVLGEAAREEEDGKTTYEISLKNEGNQIDVVLRPDGTLVAIETVVDPKALPKAVTAAIEAKYPRSTIKKAEEITEFEGKHEETNFEVEVTTAEGKSLELTLSKAGKVSEDD